eukprot:SAG31_NODE_24974_length_470_cov_1.390836_1_plen_22_part_10
MEARRDHACRGAGAAADTLIDI